MAAVTFGTAHLWGHEGTISNATVVDFSESIECANKGETVDEDGNVIERRRDDRTTTASITIKIRTGYTVASVATTLSYNSKTYEIEKVSKVTKNKDHRLITYELLTSEEVSLA